MSKKLITKRLKTLFLLLLFFGYDGSFNIEDSESANNIGNPDNEISFICIGYDTLY